MEVLTEMMEKFKINVSKITHIVTDNATNFEKSFKIFSSSLPAIHQTNLPSIGNVYDDDDLSSCSSDNEIHSEDSVIEIANTKSMFSRIKNTQKYSCL